MEQLNRQLKDGIKALGANKTPTAITRLAKSLELVSQLLENFDLEMEVNNPSGMHRRLSTSRHGPSHQRAAERTGLSGGPGQVSQLFQEFGCGEPFTQ